MLLSRLSRQKLLLSLTIRNALVPLAIATQCYFTDGSATLAEQQPCFPDKINGPCCGINKSNGDPNDICLTNGLCLAQVSPYTGLILLNGCTDPTWQSCPSICPRSIQGSYGIHVLPCPEISNDHWCCSANGSDCCADAFKLKMGTLMLSNTSSADPTPTGAAITGAAAATATTTVFITQHATATPDASNKPSCTDTDSKTMVVGVSIGVGLGACLITLLGTMWSQRRRYKRLLQEKAQFGVNCISHAQLYAPPPGAVAPVAELPLNKVPRVFELGTGG